MTAIVLPDIDRSTIDELRKRIPDLSEIELSLPTRKELNKAAKEAGKAAREAGKTAREVSRTTDETIDRLLGRKRSSVWPWVAAGVGLVAVAGAVAAWFAWFRRPAWESEPEPWTAGAYETEQTTITTPTDATLEDTATSPTGASVGTPSRDTGKSTPDSAGSAPYPIEEA